MHVQLTEKSPHAASPSRPKQKKISAYTQEAPPDDPVLQKRADAVNEWTVNMLKRLLIKEHFPVSKFSLEEASLGCALGLPGAEDLNVRESLKTFVQWCETTKASTKAWLPLYSKPEYSDLTFPQFKIMAMMTVLQKHLGARYNLSFSEGPYDPRDSRNLFIHGLLEGFGGACVSMPTLMTAVGRRLGYPLYIVEAKEHTFVRWDDPKTGERFNFDGTSPGFMAHDDLYYLNRPVPLTETDLKHFPRYLKNLTREQEIALMIRERAQCMMYNLRPFEALIAYEYADAFDPENFLLESNWAIATVVQKAFDAAIKKGRQDRKTHLRLDTIKLLPTQEPFEEVARDAAQGMLGRLNHLHGEDHMMRIA